MNLTAITEEREIIGKHFLDSLAGGVALLRDGREQVRLIDVGTGAGLSGDTPEDFTARGIPDAVGFFAETGCLFTGSV